MKIETLEATVSDLQISRSDRHTQSRESGTQQVEDLQGDSRCPRDVVEQEGGKPFHWSKDFTSQGLGFRRNCSSEVPPQVGIRAFSSGELGNKEPVGPRGGSEALGVASRLGE